MSEHSLKDMIAALGGFTAALAIARHEALEKACSLVEREAKDVIGTYHYGWPQLAPATQAERARLGYAPNEPLLRTGDLRDSITHHMDGDTGFVGSTSEIAPHHEFGTSRIPPRSFLGGAAAAKEEEIHALGATALQKAVAGTLKP